MPGGVDRGHPGHPEVPGHGGLQERRHEPAGGRVHVHRDVRAARGGQLVQVRADLGDRLVTAVHGRAHDRYHADGVLVAAGCGLRPAQVQPALLHRHLPRLHLPVPAELVPAHLDVRSHHQVGPGGVQASLLPALPPAPQQRHATQHARLARPGGRGAGGRLLRRRVPQIGQDADAARFEFRGLRVLILVDHVLGQAVRHQLGRLRLHPGGHERGQVEPGVAVQDQLVAYRLQCGVRQQAMLGQPVPRDGQVRGPHVDRVDLHLGIFAVVLNSPLDGHGLLPGGCGTVGRPGQAIRPGRGRGRPGPGQTEDVASP